MPGVFSRVNSIINSVLPSNSAAFTRMAGLAVPLDPFLTGTVRFGKKVGELMACMIGDNAAELVNDVPLQSQVLVLNNVVTWITIGCKLLIRNIELVTVHDFVINASLNQMTIRLEEKVRAFHPAISNVLLYGQPIDVIDEPRCAIAPGTFTPGLTLTQAAQMNVPCASPQSILVTSPYKIYNPDVIAIGFSNYQLQRADLVGSTSTTFTYRLWLTNSGAFPPPAASTYPKTGSKILLRCYPAYESLQLPIPPIPPSQTSIGPCCIDWLSGVVTDDLTVEEDQVLSMYDVANNPIKTNFNIEKNFLCWEIPIRSDVPLFWDVLRGSVNWNGNETLCFHDDNPTLPAFELHFKCSPVIPNDQQVDKWRIRVFNDNPQAVLLTVTLDPNPPQSFTIPGNTSLSVLVNIPAGYDPIERIYLAFVPLLADNVTPGGQLAKPIRLGNWFIDKPTVASLTHVVVAKTTQRFRYATTGLFVKPIFLSTDFIKVRLDFNANMNNGLVLIQQ